MIYFYLIEFKYMHKTYKEKKGKVNIQDTDLVIVNRMYYAMYEHVS